MKNEFDNKLTDKGWHVMRRLLDIEMPEQRRRRFAWWPLALFLLPLAVAGGWWLYRHARPAIETPPPVAAPRTTEPIATADGKMHPENEPATIAAGMVSDGPEDINSPGKQRAEAENHMAKGNIIPQFSGNIRPNPSQQTYPEKEPSVASASVEMQQHEVVVSETAEAPGQPLFSEDILLPEKFSPLALLPDRPITYATVTAARGCFAGSQLRKATNKQARWSFGLAAGLASESFAALNGFSTGVAVDWQFHRKWGLRSGLQYAQYRLPADERLVVSLPGYDYAEATGNDVLMTGGVGNPSPNAYYPTVLVPVERLRQLEMPVLAYWQPLRTLRIFGGIATAYNLSAQASQQNYANNQSYYTTNLSAQKNLNDLTSKTISRWQLNWQAGAGIRLGRHFELDAFYKHGISGTGNSDSSNLDSFGNYNPGLPANTAGTSHYFLLNGIWFF